MVYSDSMKSPLAVAWRVWKALFFRETVTRLASGRAAWIWILVEPLAHVVALMTIFGFVFPRRIGGIDGAMFIMTGLLGFILVRNVALRCKDAISANTALFAYRQVLPVDAVLVRACVEGFLSMLSALVLLIGAGLCGYAVVPHDLLLVFYAFFGLWLFGLGFGLVLSVSSELVPEIGRMANLLFLPLYFLSGVMFSSVMLPHQYRPWLFINPLLHGIESLRGGFFPQYHVAGEASLSYLFFSAIMIVFLGLALHVRFARRMVAQ